MELSIGENSFRRMVLLLLDNKNGIDIEAYKIMSGLIIQTENSDILEAVDITENEAYIGETFAEEELAKIEERMKADELEEPEEIEEGDEFDGTNEPESPIGVEDQKAL